jgi:hypothetical protein
MLQPKPEPFQLKSFVGVSGNIVTDFQNRLIEGKYTFRAVTLPALA